MGSQRVSLEEAVAHVLAGHTIAVKVLVDWTPDTVVASPTRFLSVKAGMTVGDWVRSAVFGVFF